MVCVGILCKLTRIAYTSFRSTVYELLDNKIEGDGQESFEDIMDIFLNQVQLSECKEEYLEIEKGAVLGEARASNSSYFYALLSTLENHGGSTFKISKRFPIGKTDVIRKWNAEDLKKYYNKWYKLSNMRLYIVGDYDLDKLEGMVTKYWSEKVTTLETKPTQVDTGYSTPAKPLIYMDEVTGLNGISFYLMTTSPYQSYPRDKNYYRKETGDLLFSAAYTLQVMGRMALLYPDMDFTTRMAGCQFSNEYMFASKLGMCVLVTPGPAPELSTWREDFKIAIQEMKSIADGPYSALLLAISYVLDAMYSIPTYYANTQDSVQLAYELLGNEDPNFEYLNVHDAYDVRSEFHGISFAMGSMVDHVQASAQFLLQGLSDIVDPEKPTLYSNIVRSNQTSASIILGKTDSPKYVAKPNMEQIVSHIRSIIKSTASSSISFDASTLSLLSLPTSSLPTLEEAPAEQTTTTLQYKSDSLGVSVYSLANGLRVNFKTITSNMSKRNGLAYIELVALGGKNTETSEIKGACEFVNENIIGGSRYFSDSGKEYFYAETPGLVPSITCSSDLLSITTTLSSECINYPSSYDSLCTVSTQSYASTLEALRLAMHPIYNNAVKQKVVTSYQKSLDITSDDQLANMRVINDRAIGEVIKRTFPNEPRLHIATLDELRKINPIVVQQWVSQHFSLMSDGDNLINRFEINVVGDVEITNILKQLNKWFGGIQRTARRDNEVVGYDIYDKNQVQHFHVEFPKHLNFSTSTYKCEVPSFASNKALITSIYPSNGASSKNPSLLRLQFHNALLSSYSFDVVRSKGGFSYFAISKTDSMFLLDNLSLSSTMFYVGDYPNHQNDNLNIERSVSFWIEYLKKDLDSDFFESVRQGTRASYSNALDVEGGWLRQIRGLSITAPATYASTQKYLRSESDVDILTFLNEAKYEDYKDIFSSVASQIESGMTTVMLVTDKAQGNPVCNTQQ